MRIVKIRDGISIGDNKLVLIAGPCVIEDEGLTFEIAGALKDMASRLSIPYIFKASFDKANRSSVNSYRGPGIKKGLEILAEIKKRFDLPILTDVHECSQVGVVADVVDVIQVPAFLCRQTDLILETASSGKPVNIKKGQFMAPWDVKNIIEKFESTGNKNLTITERGVSFGYNNLINDMKSLPIIREMGVPVIYDATHSVQLPGGQGACSGGQREYIQFLSRGAVAVGCDGIFFECHPDPDSALCDGANSLSLEKLEDLLTKLIAIDRIVKE